MPRLIEDMELAIPSKTACSKDEKIEYLTNMLELARKTIAVKDTRIQYLEKEVENHENLSLRQSFRSFCLQDSDRICFTCDMSTRSDPMKQWSLDVVICFDTDGNCLKIDAPRQWIIPKVMHEISIPSGEKVSSVALCTQNVGELRIKVNGEEFTIDCVHWSDSRYRDGGEWESRYNNLARYWAFTYIDIEEQSSTFLPFSELPRSVHRKLDHMKYFVDPK